MPIFKRRRQEGRAGLEFSTGRRSPVSVAARYAAVPFVTNDRKLPRRRCWRNTAHPRDGRGSRIEAVGAGVAITPRNKWCRGRRPVASNVSVRRSTASAGWYECRPRRGDSAGVDQQIAERLLRHGTAIGEPMTASASRCRASAFAASTAITIPFVTEKASAAVESPGTPGLDRQWKRRIVWLCRCARVQ